MNRLRRQRLLAFLLIATLLVVAVVPGTAGAPASLLSPVWSLFTSLCIVAFAAEAVRQYEQLSNLRASLAPRAPPAFS